MTDRDRIATEREIISLRRKENGTFVIHADGELSEVAALLPIELWRTFNNILEKRRAQLTHDQKQIKGEGRNENENSYRL